MNPWPHPVVENPAARGGLMLRSRIRLAAALAAAALLLTACGGDESGAGSGSPAEIKVFAAASLTAAFTEIGQRYTSANGGTRVSFNFAGSPAPANHMPQCAP